MCLIKTLMTVLLTACLLFFCGASAGSIEEGDELDQLLGEVVYDIIVIAEVVNETPLTRAVNGLVSAYNDMNADKFETTLDSVFLDLDRLYVQDC